MLPEPKKRETCEIKSVFKQGSWRVLVKSKQLDTLYFDRTEFWEPLPFMDISVWPKTTVKLRFKMQFRYFKGFNLFYTEKSVKKLVSKVQKEPGERSTSQVFPILGHHTVLSLYSSHHIRRLTGPSIGELVGEKVQFVQMKGRKVSGNK